MIALHLAIDRHRLGLHAADGAEHQNGAVEHAQAAFHFDGEIDVARGVDQIDRVALPFHLVQALVIVIPLFAFQVHVVHGRAVAAAFHFVNA